VWLPMAKATGDAQYLSMRDHMHPVPVLSRVYAFTSSKLTKIHKIRTK
jgi:hypothetical protein